MSRAVIGAGGQPSGWDSSIEGNALTKFAVCVLNCLKARKNCLIVGLTKAQMAETGKAGAVRLCTYRRRELGPHLDGVPWRHLHAANLNPSRLVSTRPMQTANSWTAFREVEAFEIKLKIPSTNVMWCITTESP